MVGRTISHYRIVEKIGEGGMGVVYKARDTHLDRFVAIKLLRPDLVDDAERRRRFAQEGIATRRPSSSFDKLRTNGVALESPFVLSLSKHERLARRLLHRL